MMSHKHDPKYNISVVTPPVNEPLSLVEAKAHLRVLSDDDDTYINDLIKYAREMAEERMDRAIITQTLLAKYDRFPLLSCDALEIHRSPLITISLVQYLDANGDLQTWDSAKYQFDSSQPARLAPINSESYPVTQSDTFETVRVTYTAGYGADSSSVPQKLRQAMLLLIGHGWINREEVTTGFPPKAMIQAADSIFTSNKVWTL